MAKKELEVVEEVEEVEEVETVEVAPSRFTGGFWGFWGTQILRLIVVALFCGVGFYIATMNIWPDKGGTLMEDLAVPMNWVYILIGGALCGIGICWSEIINYKWHAKHTVVSNQQIGFNANTWSLFWNAFKWVFLSAITLGIYMLWIPVKFKKWQVKHTTSTPEIEEEEEEEVVEEKNYLAPQIIFKEYDDESELQM